MLEGFDDVKRQLAELRAEFEGRHLDSEAMMKRIERSCEFLAENQARLSSALHELTRNMTELTLNQKQITADLAKIGRDVGQLVTVAAAIIHALEEHQRDGHGPEKRKK